jgi:hypothetical protein
MLLLDYMHDVVLRPFLRLGILEQADHPRARR